MRSFHRNLCLGALLACSSLTQAQNTADQPETVEEEQLSQSQADSAAGTQSAPASQSTQAARKTGNLGWIAGGAAVAGLAAAAGGGGGGGGGGNTSSPPSAPPPEEDNSAKLLPLGAEYLFTNGYNISYGHVAHDRDFTGAGQRIALIDSGIRSSHTELDGQIAAHYNVFSASNAPADAQDSDGHGTLVAGVIAAKLDGFGNVGYAHGAQLLNVRFTDDINQISATEQQLANGFAWARQQGARWFNNSWSISVDASQFSRTQVANSYPTLLAEWQHGVSQGHVYVWAAGNNNGGQPLLFAALPIHYPELQSHWLAVVNVDPQTGQLHASSSRCGNAAAWCLAAPGTNINSSYNNSDTGYATATGTSVAAPAVTGALAVISEAFPTLSGAQVVERLLSTAEKTGDYANQTLYGQGLLDLERATRPVGSLQLLASDGQHLSLESAVLSLGTPFGNINPLAGQSAMATDSLGAGFSIDLGSAVHHQAYRFVASDALNRLGRHQQSEQQGDYQLTWHSSPSGAGSRVLHIQQELGRSLHLGLVEDFALLSAHPVSHGQGLLNISLAAPFWLQQPGESSLGLRQRLPLGNGHLELTSSASSIRQGGALGYQRHIGENYQTTWELGYLRSRDGLFNSRGLGLFGLDDRSDTWFSGLYGHYQNGPWLLGHAAWIGHSQVSGQGLLRDLGRVTTSSWQLNGHYQQQLNSWGLALQQPLRVERADTQVWLATGYSGNQFAWQPVKLDLAPSGRQLNLELSWQRPLWANSDLKLSWLGIHQPGHQADAAPMQVVMGQWQQRF